MWLGRDGLGVAQRRNGKQRRDGGGEAKHRKQTREHAVLLRWGNGCRPEAVSDNQRGQQAEDGEEADDRGGRAERRGGIDRGDREGLLGDARRRLSRYRDRGWREGGQGPGAGGRGDLVGEIIARRGL